MVGIFLQKQTEFDGEIVVARLNARVQPSPHPLLCRSSAKGSS